MARARLFVTQLETRENPSITYIDPLVDSAPPPADPVPPPDPTDPAILAVINAAAGVAGGTTVTSTDAPLLGTDDVYNIPLTP